MSNKSTIVIVPETWCPPNIYDPLAHRLERAGYRVRTTFLPSTGDKPICKRGTEDVDIIAATIGHCASRGEDIVVVAHGAGAASAGDAVIGLCKADRVERRKRGGVIRIVYLAGVLTECGQTVSDLVGAHEWVVGHGEWDIPARAWAKDVFCPDIADLDIATKLKPSATSVRARNCVHAAWKYVPSSYLICETSGVVPLAMQEEMAALPGARCDVETVECGHLPFLSRPEFTTSFIRRAAGERI